TTSQPQPVCPGASECRTPGNRVQTVRQLPGQRLSLQKGNGRNLAPGATWPTLLPEKMGPAWPGPRRIGHFPDEASCGPGRQELLIPVRPAQDNMGKSRWRPTA